MNFQTIGDLAQSFALRRDGVALKQQIERLSGELSSGQVADPARHLEGGVRPLADIEHRLTVLSAQRSAAREAATDTGLMQTALEQVQTIVDDLAQQTSTLSSTASEHQLDTLAASARQALDGVTGALNSDIAGRSLFAGSQTDTTPLAPARALISAVQASLADASDPADVKNRLDAFFETDTGGFQDLIYRGGRDAISAYRLGAGESVSLDIRADDPTVKAVLKNMAVLAVAADESLALDTATRLEIAQDAGRVLRAQNTDLSVLRGNLGTAEAHIERASTRLTAEIAGLEIARSNLIGSDPFETAVELEQAQFQLEALYTVASRASRLSLVNFL